MPSRLRRASGRITYYLASMTVALEQAVEEFLPLNPELPRSPGLPPRCCVERAPICFVKSSAAVPAGDSASRARSTALQWVVGNWLGRAASALAAPGTSFGGEQSSTESLVILAAGRSTDNSICDVAAPFSGLTSVD